MSSPPIYRRASFPWVAAALISGALAIYHRAFFIGLALYDDALYQTLAKWPEGPLFERWSVRAGLLSIYHAALMLSPSRSVAILALGWLKAFVLIGCSASLLGTQIDPRAAVAVAAIATCGSLLQIEYTVLFPDSMVAAISVAAIWALHLLKRSRYPIAGFMTSLAMYTKEQAIPTVVAVLAQTPRQWRAIGGVIAGAVAAIAALTALMSIRLGAFWQQFFPFVDWFRWAADVSQKQGTALKFGTNVTHLRSIVDGTAAIASGIWFPSLGEPWIHYLTSAVLGVGVVASIARRNWRAAPARGLLWWWVLFTGWIAAAVIVTGVYEWRYWLIVRWGLVAMGLAGWWLVLQPRRWGAPSWMLLTMIVGTVITLNGLSVHHYYWLNAVGINNVERRVVDAIDRLPVTLPVVLAIDESDPEDAIQPGWFPERIRMRLIALSETSPPRRFLLAHSEEVPADAIVVTNVRPVEVAGRHITRVFLENMPSVENLWLSIPSQYAGMLPDVPFDERSDTLWRPRPRITAPR